MEFKFSSESKRRAKLSDERIEIQQNVLLERLHQLLEFMKDRLGEKWPGNVKVNTPQKLIELIQDGMLLCYLVGEEPKTTQSNGESTPAKFAHLTQYNISLFHQACIEIGVRKSSLFSVSDLLRPSSLSAMCVINGLTELRLCMVEMERKTMKEHPPTIQWDKVVPENKLQTSPIESKSSCRKSRQNWNSENLSSGNPEVTTKSTFSSPRTRDSASKGLLDLISNKEVKTSPTNVVVTPRSPEINSNSRKDNRRVSINSINAQASVARVQEKIASSFKAKCKSLARENHELHTSIEDLQDTIKSLTVSKEEYKEQASKLNLKFNELKNHFEVQVRASFEQIVKEIGRQKDTGEGDLGLLNQVVNACIQTASMDNLSKSEENNSIDELCSKLNDLSVEAGKPNHANSLIDANLMTKRLEEQISCLQKQKMNQFDLILDSLGSIKYEFGDLSNDFRNARDSFAYALRDLSSTLTDKLKKSELNQKNILRLYRRETARRKKLLNTVHHLKGNIRVLCRVRPKLENEEGSVVVKSINEEMVAVSCKARGHESYKQFEFDRVFGPTATQALVFDEVEPLIESVLDGFQSCIFAYGQTGSGKTYTMSGDGGTNRGINYLALEKLFEIKENTTGRSFTITVSNVEIYCEHIIDLLCDQSDDKPPEYLELRESKEGVFMPGCKEIEVQSVQEIISVMDKGAKNRSASNTKMNAASSRSHSVVLISVVGKDNDKKSLTMGKLVLVDLAGSERLNKSGVSGKELKEAQHINRSLSCLGDVIAALESKSAHIPFRNSKLTSLLKDALGKDNKALMIVQVSPTDYNSQESLCSLLFASRVRKCELGKAKKKERSGELERLKGIAQKSQDKLRGQEDQINEKESVIKNLKKEVSELTKKMESQSKESELSKAAQVKELRQEYDRKIDKLVAKTRSDESELKSLREKLRLRDKDDDGKILHLESRLQSANLEIQGLKQQLMMSISNPHPSNADASTPDKPLPSPCKAAGKENEANPPELSEIQNKKHVSFKNTPQIIHTKRRSSAGVSRLMAPTISSSSHTAPTTRKSSGKNKALGSASRILQTPGRNHSSRAPRRIPAEKRRPKWN